MTFRKNDPLTADRLRKVLDYDQDTGMFTWRIAPRGHRAGTLAGTISAFGYRVICIDQLHYYAHRLVWLHVYGRWPKDQIDHKHGCRADTRLSELREATNQQNCMNQGLSSDNVSGHKCVSWHKRDRRWRATITVNGKSHYLGGWKDKADAVAAVQKRAPTLQGEFARL